MELGECSTSTPPPAKRLRGDAFDGVTPHASATSSAVRKKGPWDVFINHRGCDTKHKLASTIYHTLDLIGLRAFLDVEELELGDSLPQEIQEAMHTAGLHIAIFSKRYAESPWCLAELSYMLQTGTPIIPVFYHVDPTALRWVAQGKGCYAHAFSEHEEKGRYPSSMLNEWKTALERVSNLSGHVLNSNTGDEGMLLKSIVYSVLRVLKREPLEVAKHPVGMDKIVEDFERSRGEYNQSEEHVQIAGIVGFGGSGKTTLATEFYNRKSSSFHHSSCLYDVRDAASKNNLHTKQKKLLEDFRIKTDKSFDNVREGKGILADRLKGLRVLIVLDDVDHEDQLDALLPPTGSLGSGSLVIITTREGEVLTKWGITSIYKMQPLQHLHAKQLFCWHAFLQPLPLEGFEDLVENYIDASKGLPLSLKVIGGQLYGKSSKDYWVCQLNKIKKILPKEILEMLKVSYNALDEYEKEIFLDIACFFNGKFKSRAISVWNASGWIGQCSWETLHNKCLVEDMNGYIRMHDHLRDLGRQIAKTHSPLRICHQIGTQVVGITDTRDRRVGFEPRDGFEHSWFEKNEFTKECAELTRGLLWLEWVRFEHTSIPSWLSLDKINILHISGAQSLETLWEDAKPPLQLRELLIQGALKLQSLPRSIGRLKHLKKLSLEHCTSTLYESTLHQTLSSLSSLPEEFCELQSLEHLVLRGCDGLSSLPNCFGNLVNLRHLDLSFCKSLQILPESFKQLTHFEYLDLGGCNSLRSLENITNLKAIHFLEHPSLRANQTSAGQLSLSFPAALHANLLPKICELSELKYLEIFLPEGLTTLPSLENLSSLTTLNLENCFKLTTLPASLGNLSSLTTLNLENCVKLTALPASLGNLSSLTTLNLEACELLTMLPDSLGNLSSLTTLNLDYCEGLTMLPDSLGNLSSLTTLNLKCCDGLTTLPTSLGNLSSLTNLNLQDCNQLTTLPASMENLSSLTTLNIEECGTIYKFASFFGNLSSLTTLELKYYQVESLPIEIGQLYNLRTLKIVWCRNFEEPRLEGLVSFKKIEGLELFPSLEKLHLLRTCRRCCFYGIHSLVAVERLQTVNLSGYNIRTLKACVQSIQIKSWPSEMTICGKVFPRFESILDSFMFPGLVVVDSFVHPSENVWSLTCQEANLSNAAVVCYLVKCDYISYCDYNDSHPVLINEVESSRVELGAGEWIVISVFREVSRLVEDGGGSLHASIKLSECGDARVVGGRLMVGERDCIVKSFKKLFQTLCNAAPFLSSSSTSISSSSSTS